MGLQDVDPAEWDMLTALRRDIHAHPELGFEEERTAGIVRRMLAKAGVEVHAGLGKTGVVGTLKLGDGTRRIALRADMDALAMPETAEDRPYKSRTSGKMHACGHDGHTVMLLGAARRLAQRRNFSGTVHFVFQPAEEGRGGARAMIDDGFFRQFPVDAVYGLHNMPGLPPDEMAVVAGPQLASSDRWSITFEGIGTHGAKPHFGRDAMTAAGQFLTSLHTIVARRIDPLQPAVISACAIEGGHFEALNVIPDKVRIGGTARAFTPAVRDQIEEEIGEQAKGVAGLYGVACDYRYFRQMPPVVNDAGAAARALKAAQSALGVERVRTAFAPSTAGDDFAMFSSEVPGAYVWLGNGPAEDGALHHNSRYDFNDAAIPSGVGFWTTLVEQELDKT
ncbi:M20 aminoacylase family protein [Mesorhizobium sp. 1B3]|uniref:M20 aminoacylase family protein n=1 Tax=Mesorhizobium sp. 1B3 TaxID=3243599 RepID=UPI003D966F6C